MLAPLQSILPEGLLSGHFAGMAALVFGAALMQGVGGIGVAMVSAPLAVLFFPELAPGPLLVLGGGLALLGALRDLGAVNWHSAGDLMLGRIGGTVVAGATLSILSATLFSVVFALLILIGVGVSLCGWRVPPSRPNMIAAGIASGVMGTITSSGAPPYAIVMQHVPPAQMRGTLGCVFFAGAIISLVMLALVGLFTVPQLLLGFLLFPPMILGFATSTPLNGLFSRDVLRIMVLALAGIGAAGILARAIWLA